MEKFSWADRQSYAAFPIDKAGYPLIAAAAFVTAILALLELVIPALAALFITFFICFFFRDPDRLITNDQNAVVSPADGRVIKKEEIQETRYYEGECIKVSIFMSIFNVHVNRIPFSGVIDNIEYYPGKFFRANLDKSDENEHNAITVETENGQKICFVQIAGLVARRIICRVQENDEAKKGARFGIICFGSRLDVYLPIDTEIEVSVGDKVKAGTSILGYVT